MFEIVNGTSFASQWSESSFRFKKGDKAVIVNEDRCKCLDKRFFNKYSHAFMGGKEVTIEDVLTSCATIEPTYIIEEVKDYFWEDSFFE